MARLPTPGQDSGAWGDILNDFLLASHNTDGTLKPAAVTSSGAASDSTVVHNSSDETIAGVKTFSSSPIVPTPTTSTQATNKAYVDSTASAGAPDASTTTKGIVRLTGDLAGTASSPTVPGLTTKEPTITAGTTGQYYRGDKSFQTLDKAAVGLANVDNTSDANKPVSSATTTALNLKIDKSTATTKGDILAATAASTIVPVGVGTDGQILTADAASAPGVKWAAAPTAPVTSVVGQTGVITGAQIAGDSALTSTYAGVTTARPSNLVAFLGDSITVRNDSFNGTFQGESYPTYAAFLSGQRIRKIKNAGISGNKISDMLARFDTDVTPYAPGTVFVLAGTNDTGNATSLTSYQASMRAIVAKIRAISAVPVLATIPPNSSGSPGNRRQLIIQFNSWLRTYCALQKITLVDFYMLLTDPATGNWKAAYPSGDGTHPDTAANIAMGTLVSNTLSSIVPPNVVALCCDDIDENNMLLKGCFGGYSGSALPTGYSDNAGTTGTVLSYTTDAAVAGQMLTITSTSGVLRQLTTGGSIGSDTLSASAAAGAATVTLATINPTRSVLYLGSGATAEVCRVASVSGTGPFVATLVHATIYAHSSGEACVVNAVPGDTLACSGIFTSDGGVTFTVKVQYTGGAASSQQPVLNMPGVITRAKWYDEFVVPTGTTAISFRPQVSAGTGVVSFGQVGIYNLTKGGSLA